MHILDYMCFIVTETNTASTAQGALPLTIQQLCIRLHCVDVILHASLCWVKEQLEIIMHTHARHNSTCSSEDIDRAGSL
jgi:hypothetical protein